MTQFGLRATSDMELRISDLQANELQQLQLQLQLSARLTVSCNIRIHISTIAETTFSADQRACAVSSQLLAVVSDESASCTEARAASSPSC